MIIVMPRSMPMVMSPRRSTYSAPKRKKVPEGSTVRVLTNEEMAARARAEADWALAQTRHEQLSQYRAGHMTNAELFACFDKDPGFHLYILEVLG